MAKDIVDAAIAPQLVELSDGLFAAAFALMKLVPAKHMIVAAQGVPFTNHITVGTEAVAELTDASRHRQ